MLMVSWSVKIPDHYLLSWYLIIVSNMKKIHPPIMEECRKMDRLMDCSLPYIPQFHVGGVGNNESVATIGHP